MTPAGERGSVRIEVLLGGAPLLELKVCAGLLDFGLRHPRWQFSMRGANFRYTSRWLRDQGIAGAMVVIEAGSAARTLKAAGIPWVHLFPNREGRHPCVNVDDQAIGRIGADFLLGKGFLRCAFCGVGTPWSARRAEGFLSRIREAGRCCESVDISLAPGGDWGLAVGSDKRLREWVAQLGQGVAVMAANDAMANRLVDACLQQRVRVPQDLAVLGVGNHDVLCRLSPVPISSVEAGVAQAIVCAAATLESMIRGETPPAMQCVPPIGVVERRSTDILVYGDNLIVDVVAYIRDHVADGLQVEDLPRLFPVSLRTLFRRFARCVGHSPAVEIRRARLALARRLLDERRLSRTEIAAACGYADLSHMDRLLRRHSSHL
jgi:LacI family transcriptional regulator